MEQYALDGPLARRPLEEPYPRDAGFRDIVTHSAGRTPLAEVAAYLVDRAPADVTRMNVGGADRQVLRRRLGVRVRINRPLCRDVLCDPSVGILDELVQGLVGSCTLADVVPGQVSSRPKHHLRSDQGASESTGVDVCPLRMLLHRTGGKGGQYVLDGPCTRPALEGLQRGDVL